MANSVESKTKEPASKTHRRRRPLQGAFVFRTHGGARKNAGRKAKAQNVGLIPHVARPALDRHVPMHVTLRGVRGVPNLRSQRLLGLVRAEIARASRDGFRVVHFSVQTNHLHLLVEADAGVELSRGVQRLASRVARLVNLAVGRHGRFWRERYHRRDLATPRQVRNALVYVLFNVRKHTTGAAAARARQTLDVPGSSVLWNEAWNVDDDLREVLARARAGPPPVAAPRTFLARRGWLRHGALRIDEMPRVPG